MKFDWGSILEIDEKARVKELMRRPGLFVGTARLDYLLHFAAGSDLAGMIRKKDHPIRSWNVNVELQHWMLTRHSAIIRGDASLNAQSLFFRYFGTGTQALSEFSRYLHCDEYPIIIFNDEAKNPISNTVYSLYQKEKDNRKSHSIKREVTSIIEEWISRDSQPHDEIRIYIRRVNYFTSIRFVYHTNQGWKDDTVILKDSECFPKLLKLHALLECLDDSELTILNERPSKFFVHADVSEINADHKMADIGHLMKDDDALVNQYEQWKISITSTY